MSWEYVEAVCNCPHELESTRITVLSDDVDSVSEAKEIVNEEMVKHLWDSEYCSTDTVDKTVYREDDW